MLLTHYATYTGKAGDRSSSSSAVRGKWQTLMEVGDQSWKETAKVSIVAASVCMCVVYV